MPTAIVLAVALAIGIAPTGDAIASWLQDLVAVDESAAPPPEPRLERLPANGQLLATGASGAWVIARDGQRQRLGEYEQLAWSPRGLFVAATRDDVLRGLETDGTVRWTVSAPDRVADARWAPSGYRVTYRSGDDQWVVAGDGSEPRALVPTVAPVAAAWRPTPDNVLAVARADGAVEVWAVDEGRRRARIAAASAPPPVALLWLNETMLVIVRPDEVQIAEVWRRGIRTARTLAIDGAVTDAAIFDGRLALADGAQVMSVSLPDLAEPRVRLTAAGEVSDLVSSPDASRLLVASDAADQWVFLPGSPTGPVRSVTVRGFSRVSDWQTEPLASSALADGRRIALTAFSDDAGACLTISGVDEFDRQCGRVPSQRVPAVTDAIAAGPIAQRTPADSLEVYGETSAAVERVVLAYRVAGTQGEQDALLLRVRDPNVLRRAGIAKPFGYYFAELPSRARRVVATAFDSPGAALGTDDYRDFHDLDRQAFITNLDPGRRRTVRRISPRRGGRFTRFRIRFRTQHPTGVSGDTRRSYGVSAESTAPAAGCVNARDSFFPNARAGERVTTYLDPADGKGGPEGWCPGSYLGTITYYQAYACPARGTCAPPADAADKTRVVARFAFQVRP
ncbi:MAG: hypothetical protein WKF94_02260 [Solirubrobacteraceae bacterium]